MSEQTATRLWGMRLAFALLVCLIMFFHLLPLETSPQRWVGPDLLLGFACAWSLRRPEYVPTLALAGFFLLADLLLFRPPGLWAMLALLGCEQLKSRARGMRDSSFINEWLTVCLVIAGVTLAYRFALMLTLIEVPGLGLSIMEMVATMLFYPIVIGVTHWVLGVRKAAPGALESGGGKL
ncbi:MAG: rod shape-determining protein MreD [Roseobacter sp.]